LTCFRPSQGEDQDILQPTVGVEDPPGDPTVTMEVDDSDSKVAEMQKIIQELQSKLLEKESQNEALNKQIQIEKFGISRFSHDPDMIRFYTGFKTYTELILFFETMKPVAHNMASVYYHRTGESTRTGKPRTMLLIDEMFMFLCRLRVGLKTMDLAVRFHCSPATVSRKIITWANFLFNVLGRIQLWLPKEIIQALMPRSFKESFPNTRVIIDCCEMEIQQPSSLAANSQLFSHYKGRTTVKCLVGIAPHGALTFLSPLYSGSVSDVEITRVSGLLDLIEPGDDVMADKGFTIKHLVAEKHAGLIIPNFLKCKQQFTPQEISENEQIASLRIHVERYIRRIKEYKLFETTLPLALVGTAPQLWSVASILGNYQGPLIRDATKAN